MKDTRTLVRRIASLALIAIVAPILAGCPGSFRSSQSLSEIAQAATPLAAGTYHGVPDEKGEMTAQPAQLVGFEGGQFALYPLDKPEMRVLRFYQPVKGTFLVEEQAPDGDSGYAFYIMRVGSDGVVSLANDTVNAQLGEHLSTVLGLSKDAAGSVTELTDSAALNWSILQSFIGKYGDELVFEPYYTMAK